MKRLSLALHVALASLLASACNSILGIDAPDLVGEAPSDASVSDTGQPVPSAPDSGQPDATASDTGQGDATIAETSRGDTATAEGGGDGGTDGQADAFDGNCTCSSDACAPVVLARGQSNPHSIVTDSTNLYWVNVGSSLQADGSIMRVGLDGTNLTALTSNLYAPTDIATADGSLYWSSVAQVIRQASAPPYAIEQLSPTRASWIAASGTLAAWTTMTNAIGFYEVGADAATTFAQDSMSPDHIAIDPVGMTLFWSATGGLLECPLAGCPALGPTAIWTSSQSAIVGIATDGVSVYWTDENTGDVYSCPTSGCSSSAPAPFYQPAAAPSRIATDGQHVYVVTSSYPAGDSTVIRLGLDGSAATVIATGMDIEGLAIGDTCAYWTDQATSTVSASAK